LATAMELDALHARFANWRTLAEHDGRHGAKARAAWVEYNDYRRIKADLPPVKFNRQRSYPDTTSEGSIQELYRRGYG
jgi:hypothetical protein